MAKKILAIVHRVGDFIFIPLNILLLLLLIILIGRDKLYRSAYRSLCNETELEEDDEKQQEILCQSKDFAGKFVDWISKNA